MVYYRDGVGDGVWDSMLGRHAGLVIFSFVLLGIEERGMVLYY